MFDNMTREWIRKFLDTLYEENEKVFILCINSQNIKETEQIIINVKDIEKRIKYLRYLNANRYNIYISVNVLEDEATTRRKEDFKTQQNKIYLDFDSKYENANIMFKKLYYLIGRDILPEPSLVVKSSIGNYQIYWTFEEKIEFDKLQSVMKKMNSIFHLDHTHDIARVFRLVGFRNWKKGGDLVMIPKNNQILINKNTDKKINITFQKYPISFFDKIYQVLQNDIDIKIETSEDSIRSIEETIENTYMYFQNQGRYKSQSEKDIAFCVRVISNFYHELDTVAPIVVNFLAVKRSDKPNPVYYANLTFQKALEYVERKKNENQQNYLSM